MRPAGSDPKHVVERSQHYVSSAIPACRECASGSRSTFHAMVALAMDWFMHFLWIVAHPWLYETVLTLCTA